MHHQFFQTRPMKFISLILSAAPVQAYEAWEELDKACEASHEALSMCIGVAGHLWRMLTFQCFVN